MYCSTWNDFCRQESERVGFNSQLANLTGFQQSHLAVSECHKKFSAEERDFYDFGFVVHAAVYRNAFSQIRSLPDRYGDNYPFDTDSRYIAGIGGKMRRPLVGPSAHHPD